MRFHVAFLLALLGLSAATGFGQKESATPVPMPGGPPAGAHARAMPYPTSMLRADPYARATVAFSAEQVGESVRTLPDGTHVTNSQSLQLIFRDSLGRTRTERPMFGSSNPNQPKMPTIVQILDPVAGVAYLLDTQGKVAHRVTLPPPPAGTTPVRQAMPPPQNQTYVVSSTRVMSNGAQAKTEYLGKQVLEGVEVEGERDTLVSPAGSQGADQPTTTVTETWRSRELDTAVLTKRLDPRFGDTTQKLINVRLGEPALSLFQPPPDYTVVEETGPSISIPLPLPQVRP
jgi:hypothetical protein